MARGVDGFHPWQAEIPYHPGGTERREKTAAGPIHVDRDIQACFLFESIQREGHRLHRLILTGEGHSQRRHHTDRVFITAREHFFRRHQQPPFLHGYFAVFDVPVAGELVPAHLHRSGHQVGLVDSLALRLAPRLPAPFHSHAAQHGRLARAGGGTAHGIVSGRGVPQVGQHMDAARLDFRDLRVFVLVDNILVDAVVHQAVDFRLLPGLAEGGQVLPGVAVQHQLVVHHRVSVSRVLFDAGETILRHPHAEINRRVDIVLQFMSNGIFVV